MHLGTLDICLRVSDIAASKQFYEGLGFQIVEGNAEEGWLVLANGQARIGLFESKFMSNEFSLNFRGTSISDLTQSLQANGFSFEAVNAKSDGTGSAILRDPDGHMIFFDTSKQELNAE